MSDPHAAPAHLNASNPATECSPRPENSPQSTRKLPTPESIASPNLSPPRPPRPLTSKQLTALSLLIMGKTDPQVCHALGIDRKTLYTWKHHHPLFRQELAR